MTEAEDDLEPSPPPRKEDVIFGAGAELPMTNAVLTFMTAEYGYREGYRRAAKLLAEHVCTHLKDQDFLVYPIVHNYRHYIELMLKHLIGISAFLSEEEIAPSIKRLVLRSHNLDQLWRAWKPLLFAAAETVGWNPITDDIQGVESYIRQLHAVDEGSFSFRYATDTNGAPSLQGMTHLNIYKFATLMERLSDYLEGIAFGFSIEEGFKSEYDAYVRSFQDEYCE